MVLHSYAKLNLYLEVLNIRKDSYHNIKTIFERIDLCDKIILKPRQDKKIKLICSSSETPQDNTNLAYRSAKLLQTSLSINKGVDIKIIKRIPVSAGLGGGSSNAASVLLGLNKLWKLNLTQAQLLNFAGKIGSDVPFFIYNVTFAEGRGRGDEIKPLKALNQMRFWHVLVVPKIKVSSKKIYQKWDSLRIKLTKPKYDVRMLILGLRKFNLSLLGKTLFNSLEEATTKVYPEVNRIKEGLKAMGVKSILMSGSGPAVFGIVSSRREGEDLSRQFEQKHRGWQVFVTRTR